MLGRTEPILRSIAIPPELHQARLQLRAVAAILLASRNNQQEDDKMKALPLKAIASGYEQCSPSEATHVRLHLPGPLPSRVLPVMIGGTRAGTANWTWNGSVDAPTLRPSVLTRGGDIGGEIVCHSWINDGKVQFLGDCSHELAGQTIELLDVE